jgi:hypothetical protein
MVFSGLASKSVARVSRFGPQNIQLRFGDLGHKITAMISCLGTQNQAGFDLLVAPQNRRGEDGVRHVSRSGGLLRLEASCSRVSESGLETGGGATMAGARGTIMKVTLGSS